MHLPCPRYWAQPFGHAGEGVLTQQSIRWVKTLALRYPDFSRLNLTWEVRSGLRKNQTALPGISLDKLPIVPQQQIEPQIADIADTIAY